MRSITEQKVIEAISKMPMNEAITQLHNRGFSITKSILFLKTAHKLSLGQLKLMVSNHPVWQEMNQVAKPFHEELINSIDKIFSVDHENLSEVRIEKRIIFN